MKYDPAKHHRRSIRLKGYDYTAAGAYFITICTHYRECLLGEIVDGAIQLNPLGQLVHAHWQRLPHYFVNLQLDAFVVMPNHIHGILYLNTPRRGAAFGNHLSDIDENQIPNATPTPNLSESSENHIPNAMSNATQAFEPGVAFGRDGKDDRVNHIPNAVPLQRLVGGSVGAIVLNFKSVTTRRINQIRRSQGTPIWQRNYYEHVIRNEKSLQFIRQYIDNNPSSWRQDQLHPGNPSKW